ncbi:MAG: phosphodiesterase [Gammaproteobacteria bacterium]|nr:phosphodiesterase [Gammaproteobacteria bacterium]
MLIAQLSDLHIKANGRKAYGRVDTATCLESCVAALLELPMQPELVLLTGDLVDSGAAAEYACLKALLAPLPCEYLLIPGNHDDRANLRAAFPEQVHLHQDPDFLHYVIDDYELRLIGLDTTIPGRLEGELCERRLRWLDARLSEAPDTPTLLFMHHPPFRTGIGHMDRQGCQNAGELGLLLERHPHVVRVLCGHVHRPVQRIWHGVLTSVCPSTAHWVTLDVRADAPSSFMLEPGAYELHWWNRDHLVSHMAFVDAFPGPFPFTDAAGNRLD